ncbi:MAG TPA: type IX secretion system protein PorQ, partial [Bacteroidales bacterium]|nr:type IX secretion system protein PorQ [Bacteroidales bacterium]
MRKALFLIICIGFAQPVLPQIGGRYTYEFLNLTASPRVAALGGKLISHDGADLGLVYHNPALVDSSMYNNISLSFVNYFADVKYGYVSYCRPIKKHPVAFGMQYINYGTFTKAEENGVITGNFYAADYALNIAASHKLDSSFTVGVDVRPLLSTYERYTSFGISTDLGITYKNPEKLYQLALVVRNLGTQIKRYNDTYEPLPFEIQLGYTQHLKYAPFNFSITAHHLETWDMSVKDNEESLESGNPQLSSSTTNNKRGFEKVADQFMRHLIFGVEFTPFKNFYARVGYNYQRRQELKVSTRAAMVGFSWGFGISISRFQLNYGRSTYHLAGASDHFSISTNLIQITCNSFLLKLQKPSAGAHFNA